MSEPTERASSPWRAALALRWTVVRRRYASPLEAVIILVVTGLAYLVGKELAASLSEQSETSDLAAAGLTLGLLVWLLAGARLAGRLLHHARELALLVPNGVSPRLVVRLRLVELAGLNAALLLPVLALVVGLRVGRSVGVSPLLLLAVPPLALTLGGVTVILAWVGARLGPLARAAPIFLALALLAAGALQGGEVASSDPRALFGGLAGVLGHAWAPGSLVLTLADGDPTPMLALLLGAALAPLLADRLAPLGFGEALDRAARRGVGRPGRLWQALGGLLRPLGVVGALVRRDVVLLARGAFLRGVLILLALPLALGVIYLVAQGRTAKPWHVQFVALLVTGVLASASGFLFGVDFPRARRDTLLLERVLPVRAVSVLISRWLLAIGYGALLALGAALVIWLAPRPLLANQALPFLPKGLLLVLVVAHHAVTYGLRSEAQLDPAEAAAYPLNGAVVVILFAIALLVHPLLAVGYPVLWFGFTRQALRRWETAEVETMHGSAA